MASFPRLEVDIIARYRILSARKREVMASSLSLIAAGVSQTHTGIGSPGNLSPRLLIREKEVRIVHR